MPEYRAGRRRAGNRAEPSSCGVLIAVGDEHPHAFHFDARGLVEGVLVDDAVGGGSDEGGAEDGIFDVTAGDFKFGGEFAVIDFPFGEASGTEHGLPESGAFGFGGFGERDAQGETSCEGFVDACGEVGGEDGDAGEAFDALEEVVDFEVGVFVVGVFDVGALAEKRICFIKKQHCLCIFSLVKDLRQILFGLADVF